MVNEQSTKDDVIKIIIPGGKAVDAKTVVSRQEV